MIDYSKDRLLKLSEVQEIVGLSPSTIYLYVSQGRFPRQFKIGGYLTRWSEAEVRLWIAEARDSREGELWAPQETEPS